MARHTAVLAKISWKRAKTTAERCISGRKTVLVALTGHRIGTETVQPVDITQVNQQRVASTAERIYALEKIFRITVT